MAYSAVRAGEAWGLPTNFPIVPQFLKELNYSTNFLGKWHLGAHTRAFLPGARGFDCWFGITQGRTHPFNYTTCSGAYGGIQQG
ncbi:hypothetical protein RvY_11134 [Ramazzottius varieornatus]|uniref:Sulfatase N-terminal domain-containing protein n=1 Tax=Ramazzottius varieornatus TaxID=947166 RepID=A0A1D1VKJ8_RAMVA|nr:hypothetical protein RvY_11134 [Ramazzottius varieornatus]